MRCMEVTQELEQSINIVCDFALKHSGAQVFLHVKRIADALQDSAPKVECQDCE